MEESKLEKTLLLLVPNVAISFRLTELRIWAEKRSSSELHEFREHYLGLAEKRIRLQMQLKGTKKLFGAFKSINLSTAPNNKIILPNSNKDTPVEVSNAGSQESKSPAGSLLAPKPLGLAAPALIPAASAGAATGGGMTARQKRMSMLQTNANKDSVTSNPSTIGSSTAEKT